MGASPSGAEAVNGTVRGAAVILDLSDSAQTGKQVCFIPTAITCRRESSASAKEKAPRWLAELKQAAHGPPCTVSTSLSAAAAIALLPTLPFVAAIPPCALSTQRAASPAALRCAQWGPRVVMYTPVHTHGGPPACVANHVVENPWRHSERGKSQLELELERGDMMRGLGAQGNCEAAMPPSSRTPLAQ